MNVLKILRKVNESRSIKTFGMKLSDWSLLEWSAAVGGECGEMQNIAKKIKRGDYGDRMHADGRSDLAKEMADIIIYLDLMASREGIDLEQAVVSKFNEVSDRCNCDIKILNEEIH